MGTATMGRVTVAATIENINDSMDAKQGRIKSDEIRKVDVEDALVDTGAKLLGLPKRLIDQLGLEKFETRLARTSVGLVPTDIYRAVWLVIQGRKCTVDVAEVDDQCPVIIGYVPLELLDFVVDPVGQRLIGNPQNDGQNILDLM